MSKYSYLVISIIILISWLIGLSYVGSANTYTYQDSADTYVDVSSPTSNFDTSNVIDVEYLPSPLRTKYGLIQISGFDITNASYINTSTLKLYNSGTDGGTSIKIQDVSAPYISNTVTWNTKPGIGSLITQITANPGGGNWETFNITTLTKTWVTTNNGLYIIADTGAYNWVSFSSMSGYGQPYLTITTLPPQLISPTNASSISTSSINFQWNGAKPGYQLQISNDSTFSTTAIDISQNSNSYTTSLPYPFTYFWRVRESVSGQFGSWSPVYQFILNGDGTNTINGQVYELVNAVSSPVSGATVFLYNNTYSATAQSTSGNYIFSNLAPNTTYNLYASKDGYDTTTSFPITTGNNIAVTHNILIKATVSPYIPNYVFEKFIVRGLFDNPYPGITVTVYKGSDVTPFTTGTTDSAGQVVFKLIKDQLYHITYTGGGITENFSVDIYAKEESYLITIASGFPSGGNRFSDISANLTATTINATHSSLSLIYNDAKSSTSVINFYATNKATGTTCTQTSSAQTVTLSCTVLASGTYQFGYNATSSIYGTFQQDKIINFGLGKPSNPSIVLPGVSSTLLHWLSIIILVLLAALFSIRTVKYGAVLVPILAIVFWGFGWLQVSFLLVSTALVIGVLVYIRMSEVKVNY